MDYKAFQGNWGKKKTEVDRNQIVEALKCQALDLRRLMWLRDIKRWIGEEENEMWGNSDCGTLGEL